MVLTRRKSKNDFLNLEKEIVIQGLVRKINVNNEDIADQKNTKYASILLLTSIQK